VARRAHDLAAWSADPRSRRSLAGKARERGVAERALPHAASIVYQTLTAPLALVDGTTLPPLMEAIAFAREVEFGYPIPAVPGISASGGPPRGLVKGFIDGLVAWDDDLGCSTTRATCLPVTTSPRWRNAGCANAMPCRHGSTRSRGPAARSRRLAGSCSRSSATASSCRCGSRGHARHVEHLARPDREPARPDPERRA